jgi:Malectin domain
MTSFDSNSTTFLTVLHFLHLHSHDARGRRLFNATVEGTELPMIDLFQMAGKDNAYTDTVQVSVTNGLLTIVFTAVGNNAKVSGLEIVQSGTAAPRAIAPTSAQYRRLQHQRLPWANGYQRPLVAQVSSLASIIASSTFS